MTKHLHTPAKNMNKTRI